MSSRTISMRLLLLILLALLLLLSIPACAPTIQTADPSAFISRKAVCKIWRPQSYLDCNNFPDSPSCLKGHGDTEQTIKDIVGNNAARETLCKE